EIDQATVVVGPRQIWAPDPQLPRQQRVAGGEFSCFVSPCPGGQCRRDGRVGARGYGRHVSALKYFPWSEGFRSRNSQASLT
ncbi:MAG: hypothetical protein JWR37_1484, partial [Mycobacterium sp.]|nr:hypothetical protein [Mycobacterium sp.]